MMETKYLSAQEYLEKHNKRVSSSSIGGMSIRIDGGDYDDLIQHYNAPQMFPYFDYAEQLINKGEIFFIYPFKCDCGHARFQYGGSWACNTCGNCITVPEWWKIRVTKDGDSYCCVGNGFIDLQESSNYAFGDTFQEAIDNYYFTIKSQSHD